jgi:hypothetical protein
MAFRRKLTASAIALVSAVSLAGITAAATPAAASGIPGEEVHMSCGKQGFYYKKKLKIYSYTRHRTMGYAYVYTSGRAVCVMTKPYKLTPQTLRIYVNDPTMPNRYKGWDAKASTSRYKDYVGGVTTYWQAKLTIRAEVKWKNVTTSAHFEGIDLYHLH